MDDAEAEAAINALAEKVSILFVRLGVGSKPIGDLSGDSDWAFIIKLHSLLEASLNHLLVRHFKDDRLEDAIIAMEFGDERKGKIAFIKALRLLPPPSQAFVRKLGSIRNRLAHRIKDLDFDLKTYTATMSDDDRNALIGAMQEIMPQSNMRQLLGDSPRTVFFAVACMVLYQIEEQITPPQTSSSEDAGHLE